jgi:formylglycine-generating enzyme required for sulfatase activity
LKDMAGNVWEWTSSGYSEDYSKNRSTSKRVGRGGCWIGGVASEYRSARRYGFVPAFRGGVGPSFRVDDLGLRCAR